MNNISGIVIASCSLSVMLGLLGGGGWFLYSKRKEEQRIKEIVEWGKKQNSITLWPECDYKGRKFETPPLKPDDDVLQVFSFENKFKSITVPTGHKVNIKPQQNTPEGQGININGPSALKCTSIHGLKIEKN